MNDEPTTIQNYNITKLLPNSFTLSTNNKNNHAKTTIPHDKNNHAKTTIPYVLQKLTYQETNEEIQHKGEDIKSI